MTATHLAKSSRPLWRTLHILGLLATAFGNLIPLYGVLFRGWDTFQLLMLYWAETVVLFFWTMRRVAKLPPELLGRIEVNGVDRPFTPAMAVGFFGLHSTGFIAAHCFALWMLFSGPWLAQYHPGGVFAELFTTNGAWIALLFLVVASWISFLLDVRPAYVVRVERLLHPESLVTQARAPVQRDVGGTVGMLYLRIITLHAALVFGVIWTAKIGALAPVLIMVGVKTLADLAIGWFAPRFEEAEKLANEVPVKP